MVGPYAGFVGEVWEEFPQLAEWHDDDPSMLQMWSMEKFIEAGYHNFHAERKQLYHISKLIEKHAEENSQPMLASFEKIARYKFVEKRYQKLIEKIPKIWVIADYGETKIDAPPKINIINCKDTHLSDVWSVITRGPYGPFGLIAEEYEDGKFRGFFTLNPNVCRHALAVMGKTLGTKFAIV
ncbi:MAG: hypothetical protein HKP31_06830 [Nitrosopumilus sp.]|nr:hypothetical protein [Nitrosopumilus sp.]